MPTLAEITTETGAWLVKRNLAELPEIVMVRISDSYAETVELQLAPFDHLAGLAAWAEHLVVPIAVRRFDTKEVLQARVETALPSGYPLVLWNHLPRGDWSALEDVTGRRFDSTAVPVDAAAFRQAAERW
ncbi:hypothetical protein MOQ72_29290 [Saccharopolyspora sp. K220]|uniref:hypothetical protein n=1 Tax=Saccharopolyspora soli TaxID=2926618 RepID=UPI001F57B9CF|nr:hypothetical protein [Saccharopolyspora soli]MCI2421537.1 hypothetical protein [Saccharopolyspora soli]